VDAAESLIFLQLWHVSRVSHPVFQPGGELPVAPSAIRPAGQVFTDTKMADFVTPRALELGEMKGIVAKYARGAELALLAGFDSV
jgi:N-ethylmaleimide reductase